MPLAKTNQRRSLAVLLCVMLLFSTAFSFTAFADNAVVTSGSMYSYFQTYGSNGQWKDIQTPSHWITGTGEVAYCLQTSMDTPYNASYYTVDGEAYYSDYVLTGLMAIIQNGYPSTSAVFTDEQARYATANAIRFFLAENYCDGVPQYLNLNVNGDWIRAKSGYEELYQWSLYLVDLARWGAANPGSSGSLSFSPSTVNLTEDSSGQYFTGTTTVTKNLSGDYGIAHNLPNGSTITGHTGTKTETLTIKVPTIYENRSYTICAYGSHEGSSAKLFFWAPAAANHQRIVTYVLDTDSNYVEVNATVNTPSASAKFGSVQIKKIDADTGAALAGVSFELYDGYTVLKGSGQTDSRGILTFSNLPLGTYYCKETATLPGYNLDTGYHAIAVTENGQVASVTVRNSRGKGSIIVTKTDHETGEELEGVHFKLMNSSGALVAEGETGEDGRLYFEDIPVGTYTLIETATLPSYVLDDSPHEVTIPANERMVFLSIENDPARASIVIHKTDAETGAALSGVHFKLTDSSGTVVKEGDTDIYGNLTFSDLTLGSYTLQETKAAAGYVRNSETIPVSLTTAGQTLTKNITNSKGRGSIIITKTDHDTGDALEGVHFKLMNSAGVLVGEGDTEEDGRLYFEDIPVGTYTLIETTALPGYELDDSPREVTIPAHDRMVFLSIENYLATANIEINKTDEETGEPLAGVHFKLMDAGGNVVKEGDTDINGELTFSYLPLGTYTLQESAALTGYVIDSSPISVTLSSDGQTVTKEITNSRALGSIKIIKKDSEDGTLLMGAGYRLYDGNGQQIAEGSTDEHGELSFYNLPYGSYEVQEYSPPKGYVPDNMRYPVSLSSGSVTETRTNQRRPGTLIVRKQDTDGSPLAGAAFLLEFSADNGSSWAPVNCRNGSTVTKGGCTSKDLIAGQLITGMDGTASFTGLRADGSTIYRLTETKAPPGRSLLGESILVGSLPVQSDNVQAEDTEVFDAKAFHYTLTVTATDDSQYRLPEAGGAGFAMLPFALTVLAAPILIIKTKKEKTE